MSRASQLSRYLPTIVALALVMPATTSAQSARERAERERERALDRERVRLVVPDIGSLVEERVADAMRRAELAQRYTRDQRVDVRDIHETVQRALRDAELRSFDMDRLRSRDWDREFEVLDARRLADEIRSSVHRDIDADELRASLRRNIDADAIRDQVRDALREVERASYRIRDLHLDFDWNAERSYDARERERARELAREERERARELRERVRDRRHDWN